MDQPFQHVVIIGCGLLGTSLGLALRDAGLAGKITGVGRRGSASVDVALRRGAIDCTTDDPATAVAGASLKNDSLPPADLVILCTPLRQFPAIFSAIAGSLAPGAIVTDVGSVKGQVLRWAAESLPAYAHFVGSHPMAGSEQNGPGAARADLYRGAVCIVCPAAVQATARVIAMWRGIGMRVVEAAPDLHDRHVAAISHLPHITAAMLVNAAADSPDALELAAGGFLDTTRIASSDVTVWTDIFLTNREAVLHALDEFGRHCEAMRTAIAAADEAGIAKTLAGARTVREKMLDRRRPAGGD